MLGYFIDLAVRRRCRRFSPSSAAPRSIASAQMIDRLDDLRHRARCRRDSRSPASTMRRSRPAGRGLRARWSRRARATTSEAFDAGSVAAGRRSCRASAPTPEDGVRARFTTPAASPRSRIPGCCQHDEWIAGLRRRRARRDRGVSQPTTTRVRRRDVSRAGRRLGPRASPAGRTITATRRTARRPRRAASSLPHDGIRRGSQPTRSRRRAPAARPPRARRPLRKTRSRTARTRAQLARLEQMVGRRRPRAERALSRVNVS